MEKNSERPVIIIQPDMAPITLREYAQRHGITLEAVRAQVHRGSIPSLQIGKGSTIYVNQAQMIMSSLEAAGWDVKTPKEIYKA
ncbi:hypothetical protein GNP80_14955 [Aliivibrio fischeri]|uniref:DNA-binding protein n=1 Tax=Aliivibrio fischeri TaxID=668 RepID=A0A510UHV5_ALIFS|nr:hypothetical protein [Aliivibrio fischeri]MCE7576203.1 hypothetical protein [Aliivibrio fischeri]MCE7588493.1 hypothetical protein [Aliivibrio fischeri]MUK93728.1 hypothetical protein [Aliivibrio fischeri]TDM54102.1 hypothetical protein VFFQA001_05905 [Aliivibrio fischeri]TGA72037.1 hypothetical protein VFES401_06050 [Aliivibrio fischeri]